LYYFYSALYFVAKVVSFPFAYFLAILFDNAEMIQAMSWTLARVCSIVLGVIGMSVIVSGYLDFNMYFDPKVFADEATMSLLRAIIGWPFVFVMFMIGPFRTMEDLEESNKLYLALVLSHLFFFEGLAIQEFSAYMSLHP
jgi:hypothetical protein